MSGEHQGEEAAIREDLRQAMVRFAAAMNMELATCPKCGCTGLQSQTIVVPVPCDDCKRRRR